MRISSCGGISVAFLPVFRQQISVIKDILRVFVSHPGDQFKDSHCHEKDAKKNAANEIGCGSGMACKHKEKEKVSAGNKKKYTCDHTGIIDRLSFYIENNSMG